LTLRIPQLVDLELLDDDQIELTLEGLVLRSCV